MKYFLILLFLASVACTKHATRPSPEVTFKGNDLLYKGQRFTGILEEHFPQIGTVRKTEYENGLQEGLEEEFAQSGQIVARRHHHAGKKVGIHEGWFLDGKRRFHHEFKNGQMDGEVWEWYSSGAVSMFAKFENGKLLGKKMWRESGQIYMNYVFTEQGAFGVPGTSLCYQVRDKIAGQ